MFFWFGKCKCNLIFEIAVFVFFVNIATAPPNSDDDEWKCVGGSNCRAGGKGWPWPLTTEIKMWPPL